MADQDREFALLCPHCGEENPPEFPVCWSCHGDLPEASHAAEPPGTPEQSRAVDLVAAPARRKRILFEVAMVLSIVWLPWLAAGVQGALVGYSPESLSKSLWRILQGAGILALLFYLVWVDGDGLGRLGLRRPRVGQEILCALVVWAAMHLSHYLAYRITLPLGLERFPARRLDFEPAARWISPLSLLLWALVEEVFYRAYLWSRLTELTRRPVLSIAVCAMLFSLSHFYPAPGNLAMLLSGAVLGCIFWERRSLWGLVLGHWLYNLFL